jgi:dihydroorotate dehydrogenase (NAD+) catalytic subunit
MTNAGPAVDLTVSIGSGHKGDPLHLANPIIAAAGTFGTGVELQRDVDLAVIGAIVTPAISRRAHRHRPAVPVRETPSGLFMVVPYPSISLRAVLNRFAPLWEDWPVPVIANISAGDADECVEVAAALAGYAGIAAIELSFVAYAAWLDGDDSLPEFRRLCRRLSNTWPRPLIVKLPYGLADSLTLIGAAAESGVDAISLGGGFPAGVIDRGAADRARLITGRLTGPATHAYALHAAAAICAETSMPVIASGGVASGVDALDFLQSGARAVQVGSASLRDPAAAVEVARDLERLVRDMGRSSGSGFDGDLQDEESSQ